MEITNTPTPEFIKVMTNFTKNVQHTFPEYTLIIKKWCSLFGAANIMLFLCLPKSLTMWLTA